MKIKNLKPVDLRKYRGDGLFSNTIIRQKHPKQRSLFKTPVIPLIPTRIIHVDGGAFVEPPLYRFHDAYFSVVDEKGLIYFEKNCGDIYSGEAEYLAIKWAVENIPERPIKILSDCTTAIAWAHHYTKASKARGIKPLNLKDVVLEYAHGNLADIWNAENHSPKKPKSHYYQKWKENKEFQKAQEYLRNI